VRSRSFQDDHTMMLLKLEQNSTARQRYSRTSGTICCWLENPNMHHCEISPCDVWHFIDFQSSKLG